MSTLLFFYVMAIGFTSPIFMPRSDVGWGLKIVVIPFALLFCYGALHATYDEFIKSEPTKVVETVKAVEVKQDIQSDNESDSTFSDKLWFVLILGVPTILLTYYSFKMSWGAKIFLVPTALLFWYLMIGSIYNTVTCDKSPERVANNRPHWMAKHNTKLMAYYRPEWMANNRPHWMANNRLLWMAENRHEWMAQNYPYSVTPQAIKNERFNLSQGWSNNSYSLSDKLSDKELDCSISNCFGTLIQDISDYSYIDSEMNFLFVLLLLFLLGTMIIVPAFAVSRDDSIFALTALVSVVGNIAIFIYMAFTGNGLFGYDTDATMFTALYYLAIAFVSMFFKMTPEERKETVRDMAIGAAITYAYHKHKETNK